MIELGAFLTGFAIGATVVLIACLAWAYRALRP